MSLITHTPTSALRWLTALFLLAALFGGSTVHAQVGIGTPTPDPSAILELQSTSQGFLLPRMNATQMNAIPSPLSGLMVFNTTAGEAFYYDGTTWSPVAATAAAGWNLTGNAGTSPATDYIGTSDAQPLVFRTDGNEQMRLDVNGNLGIGTTAPAHTLHVGGDLALNSGSSVTAIIDSSALSSLPNGDALQDTMLLSANAISRLLSDSLSVSSLWTDNSPDISYTTGNVGIGTASTTQPLTVAGNALFQDNLFVDGAGGNRTLRVRYTGTGTPDSRVFIDNNGVGNSYTWYQASATNFTAGIYNTDNQYRIVSSNDISNAPSLAIETNGNVGIGTAAPAADLQVNGSTRLDGVLEVRHSDEHYFFDPTGDYFVYLEAPQTSAPGGFARLGAYHGPSVGPLQLRIQPAGGSVAIGNISPTARLHVNGDFRVLNGTSVNEIIDVASIPTIPTDDQLITAAAIKTLIDADTLVHFDESFNTTDSASVWQPSIGTDVGIALQPRGTGALTADTAGNARGVYAVDLQMERANPGEVASGDVAVISGGFSNTASALGATVGGGQDNTASDFNTTIAGGQANTASSSYATVGGGFQNTAGGSYSAIPGGYDLRAQSFGEVALGTYNDTLTGGFNPTSFAASDRLLTIGNGPLASNRSNALVMLKNGNTTLNGQLTLSDGANPFTLPNADGTNGQVLVTDGTGTVSWQAAPGGLQFFTEASAGATDPGAVWAPDASIGADAGIALQPRGNGYIAADVPDGATAGGAARGDYAVDLQMERANPGEVASSDWAVISGGRENTASGSFNATIGGGFRNTASGSYATIAGGQNNTAGSQSTTVGGGSGNTASSSFATVGGGNGNTASGSYATVGGGLLNTAGGGFSAIPGGYDLRAQSFGEVALGTFNDTLTGGFDPNNFAPADRLFTIGNGQPGPGNRSNALVMLKNGNTTLNGQLTLSDGANPFTLPNADGTNGQVLVTDGTGTVSWQAAPGGLQFFTEASAGATDPGAVWAPDASIGADAGIVLQPRGQGYIAANEPDGATVGGNARGINAVDWQMDRFNATEVASGDFAVISGGFINTASSLATTVGGGAGNTASGISATVGGGDGNTASSDYATVGGGVVNTASGQDATVGGGRDNTASERSATIGGGEDNTASGEYSVIPGGFDLRAQSYGEVALGTFNDTLTGGFDPANFAPADRLFTIGNGDANTNRSNALVMLKNGNTTLNGQLTLSDGSNPFTLPNADGTNGQVLTTNGSGNVTWQAAGGGGLTHFDETAHTGVDAGAVWNPDASVGSDAGIILQPNGVGYIAADRPDGFDLGGNARGDYAVDLQMERANPDEVASANYTVISGGQENTASGVYSIVGGGLSNTASGSAAIINGGFFNTASGLLGTVGGGRDNIALGAYSTIPGGDGLRAQSLGEVALGLHNDTLSGGFNTVSYVPTDRLLTIGNGDGNTNRSNALVMLKNGNTTLNGQLTLSDGANPFTLPNADGTNGQVLTTNGSGNVTWQAAGGGGLTNFVESSAGSTDPGAVWEPDAALGTNAGIVLQPRGSGYIAANVPDGFASGGSARGNNAVDLQMSRTTPVQVASGNNSVIVGGENNSVGEDLSFIGGGRNNLINVTIPGQYSAIVGGDGNEISGVFGANAFIGGGETNIIEDSYGVITGGRQNTVSGVGGVVLGGSFNTASGNAGLVGGVDNEAFSYAECVVGLNAETYTANSTSGFDADDRVFVVGNGTNNTSGRSNAMTVLKSGNVGIGDSEPGETFVVEGSVAKSIRVESAPSIAVQPGDYTLIVTDPNPAIELPDPNAHTGRIIKISAEPGSSAVVASPTGSINNGPGSIPLTGPPGKRLNYTFQSDGSTWWVVDNI